MIQISPERCTGCGECVEVCPAGALRVEAGCALVDQALCRDCEACVAACLVGAITGVAAPLVVAEAQPIEHRPAAVIDAPHVEAGPVPWRERVLPALAGVVSFTGREVLPRVLEAIASAPQAEKKAGDEAGDAPGQRQSGGGRRTRQRHRGQRGRG